MAIPVMTRQIQAVDIQTWGQSASNENEAASCASTANGIMLVMEFPEHSLSVKFPVSFFGSR
jgi:hypothetical protein